MILPESREPWGWNRPQRIVLAVLLLIGASVIGIMWGKYPVALPGDAKITHHPLPEIEELIDPNTATAASLSRIPGVGPVLAQRIVDFRDKRVADGHQPAFIGISDLALVPGIGKKTQEKLLPWLKLPQPPAAVNNGLRPARILDGESGTVEEPE